MSRVTDTGTTEAEDREPKDIVEVLTENMREARVRLMNVLEKYVESGDLHLLEAVKAFERATYMEPAKAEHYLHSMSGPNSRFKQIKTFKEVRRA